MRAHALGNAPDSVRSATAARDRAPI